MDQHTYVFQVLNESQLQLYSAPQLYTTALQRIMRDKVMYRLQVELLAEEPPRFCSSLVLHCDAGAITNALIVNLHDSYPTIDARTLRSHLLLTLIDAETNYPNHVFLRPQRNHGFRAVTG